MGLLFKTLLVFLILYFLYSWVLEFFKPSKKEKNNDRDVRVFKTKEVEESKYDIEAETIDYEEISEKEPKHQK